jgi:hypothetical protein
MRAALTPPPSLHTRAHTHTHTHSLDVPKAPELLGQLVGKAAAAAAAAGASGGGEPFSLAVLAELLADAEGAEAKRGLAGAALKAYAASAPGGARALQGAASAAGLSLGALLAADEFDGELPSVADWAKGQGLEGLPL